MFVNVCVCMCVSVCVCVCLFVPAQRRGWVGEKGDIATLVLAEH